MFAYLRSFPKLALCIVAVATLAAPLSAVERTTPVEVKNTPNVAVTNTPNVAVTNTPNVAVTNSPTVKIDGITNTVKIDPTINTVKIPARYQKVQCWNTATAILTGTSLSSPYLNCAGYRQITVVLLSDSGSANLIVYPRFLSGASGLWMEVGVANFALSVSGLSNTSNFTPLYGSCVFTLPVLSDQFYFYVRNNTGATVNMDVRCWIYVSD